MPGIEPSREATPTPAVPGKTSAQPHQSSGADRGALHGQLRGMDYASGAALLAPGGRAAPVQAMMAGGGSAPAVQMDAKSDAEALEARDGGHSLDRHGPQVTDDQLQDRLTTGIAPDNVVSPAPGLSTRFTSHDEYLATRTAAVDKTKSGLRNTHGTLLPFLKAVRDAQSAFDSEPSGPGKGVKSQELSAAKGNLDGACKAIGQSSATHFPVRFVKAQAVTDMVVLYGGYGIVLDHGRVIGSGFEGVGEKSAAHPRDSAKDDITVYDRAEPVAGGVKQTKTSFDVTGSTQLLAPHNPGAWRAGQHFPTTGQAVGITV